MAAKIKDGLFIGDAETSQSEVFINDNKISNLINLAGKEVPNIWSSHGLVYLTYNWEDRPDYRLFSGQDDTILTDIVEFVDVSIAHGISVLLFSKKGTGRCVIAACLYLMMKYRWGFEKSYDYVYSKKPDIDLNKGFIQQMFALDMKLLAARQKAYALKHGVENGFRIEPNMTINDIAAMLPPTEAKRWNSWDPNYILAPNNVTANDDNRNGDEEAILWHRYSDSVINALRKKDSLHSKSMTNKQKVTFRVMDDAEEELVLIFSFVNSKNTISSLPGPYLNVYDIQKNFKLRFDNVIFEEDVNMFPSSPVNLRYGFVPRSILKGSRQLQQQRSISQGNNQAQSSSSVNANNSNRGNEYLNSPPAEEKINSVRNSYDLPLDSARSNSTNPGASEDLYRYVGLASEAKITDQNIAKSREEKKSIPAEVPNGSDLWSVEEDRKSGMSAEERLRKLMADMQRSNHFPEHLKGEEQRQSSNNSSNRNLHPPQQSKNEPFEDNYYSTNAAISLHDLANMPVQTSVADPKSDVYRRSYENGFTNGRTSDISMVDLERDDASLKPDPLAAFNIPLTKSGPSNSSKGPLKARHDILSAGSSKTGINAPNPNRNSLTRQAWNPAMSNPVPGTNRPPSPSTARPSSPSTRPSSNGSVGSVGSNGSGNGSPLVGTGTTSSAKVYRHGSPAPNTRPTVGRQPSPRQPTGNSNISVNSNSVSSLGSGISNIPPNNTNVRSSYVAPTASRTAGSGQRYSSPLAVPPTNNTTPQRRGSFSSVNSVGSTGSNNPPPPSNSNAAAAEAARRKAFGTSPLRASYSGNAAPISNNTNVNLSSSQRPSSASISSKRFSTPTPQSEQHNSASNLSNSRAVRSSTPTKNTWKF